MEAHIYVPKKGKAMEESEIAQQFPGYNYVDTQRDLLVDALVKIYGDTCFYCDGIPFTNEENHKYSRTIDHYHSQSWCRTKGWDFEQTHGMSNLRLAHKSCNSNKSDRAWLEDGTLEPRGRVRVAKGPRPEFCDTCVSGRVLLVGETCPDCGGGPQPAGSPKAYQLPVKECSHDGVYYCRYCFVGIIPRKSELTFN